MAEFKNLTQKELKELRYVQWLKQEKRCAILKKRILFRKAVFDHKHRNKKEEIGKDGKGLLRGVLHRSVNVIEGKIARMYKRYGLHKLISLPDLLKGIAGYIDSPPMKLEYIHPSEKLKPKKLGKREYNRICKYYFQIYPKRKKLPKYPKSGKINKRFEELLEVVNDLYLKKG